MKPTIKDIAKEANVSTATVSRIINGLDGYTEETKSKVLKVIDKLGYNKTVVGLQTKTVGVLLPDIATNFYASILKGIEDIAHSNNYSVIICNTGIDGWRTLDYIKVLEHRKVDSIITIGISITEEYYKALEESRIPYIQISTISYRYQIPYIKVDSQQAAYAATKYLIDNGHKKIAMISGDAKDVDNGHHRVFGFKQALEDNNLEINPKLIKYGDFTYESGIECMRELLKEEDEFTAIFSGSDDMAIGALSVAYENNINIPRELSIIGYDNTRVSAMSIPPLTTIGQPLYKMGQKGMTMIIKAIENNEKLESIVMPYSIIERRTVKNINVYEK